MGDGGQIPVPIYLSYFSDSKYVENKEQLVELLEQHNQQHDQIQELLENGKKGETEGEGRVGIEREEKDDSFVSLNVNYTLVFTFFLFAGRSIWGRSVLAVYVYLLRNESPEAVGYVTAVMGVTQLLSSFPAGYLADKYRRDTMLKVASIVGILATVVTLYALYPQNYFYSSDGKNINSSSSNGDWKILVVALSIWGIMFGIANTVVTALFADSVGDGHRTKHFTNRFMVLKLGTTAGPIIALIMFCLLGDEWTIKDCATVMAIGQAIGFPALVLLWFFNDDYTSSSATATAAADTNITFETKTTFTADTNISFETKTAVATKDYNNVNISKNKEIPDKRNSIDAVTCSNTNDGTQKIRNYIKPEATTKNNKASMNDNSFDSAISMLTDETLNSYETDYDDVESNKIVSQIRPLLNEQFFPGTIVVSRNTTTNNGDDGSSDKYCMKFIPRKRIIPALIVLADIISGLSSGMSIQYFSIFFLKNLQLSPILVQVLFVLGPILQAGLMKLAQHLSKSYGRCYVTLLHRWIGTFCMVCMILSYVSTTNNILHFPTWVVCTFYLLRIGFMNSTHPLTKSLLMDHVPKSERGKWSALESVNMFSWSGSAVIGGFLVHEKGIVFNFCVTSGMQLLSTIPIAIASKFVTNDCDNNSSSSSSILHQKKNEK